MYTVRGKNPPAKGKPPVFVHGRLLHLQTPNKVISVEIQPKCLYFCTFDAKKRIEPAKEKYRIIPVLRLVYVTF